jgi:hypothetical protein
MISIFRCKDPDVNWRLDRLDGKTGADPWKEDEAATLLSGACAS